MIINQIKLIQSKHAKEYNKILSLIRSYNKIAIFRHIHPDFDALGSAWALKEFIHVNFMDKEVKVLGDNHDELTPRLFSKSDRVKNEWFNEPFLAIILDTPNERRIADPRYKKAEALIKIDHHPFMEKFADVELIDTNLTSVSELLANMLFYFNLDVNKKCARNLYIGLVGDSGRFQFQSTSAHTFEIAEALFNTGIDISEIYHNMYLRKQSDLNVIAYILTHYKVSKHGVAYYILTKKELSELKITTNQGKDFINLFHYVDGIKIWCAITEDMKEDCFRVSLRSEYVSINEVAGKYRGGGHKNASGAKLFSITEIDDFINDLDALIK